MTEAQQAIAREVSEPSRLLALCADTSPEAEMTVAAEAEKLTLDMIAETARWTEAGLTPGAEKVRAWWLLQVGKSRGKDEAEWFGKCWAEAFEKAEAELARMKEAQPEPEPEEEGG